MWEPLGRAELRKSPGWPGWRVGIFHSTLLSPKIYPDHPCLLPLPSSTALSTGTWSGGFDLNCQCWGWDPKGSLVGREVMCGRGASMGGPAGGPFLPLTPVRSVLCSQFLLAYGHITIFHYQKPCGACTKHPSNPKQRCSCHVAPPVSPPPHLPLCPQKSSG